MHSHSRRDFLGRIGGAATLLLPAAALAAPDELVSLSATALARRIRDKKERHRIQCERALEAWQEWLGR